jgi:WhiB family transcriptional regulator, redox-sensing transcriptional regulator
MGPAMQNLHDLMAQEAAEQLERDETRGVAMGVMAGLYQLLHTVAEQSPGDWSRRAACRGMDTDLFHKTGERLRNQAISVCRTCPVKPDCLAWVLSLPQDQDKSGIYAGTDPAQRREMRRKSVSDADAA